MNRPLMSRHPLRVATAVAVAALVAGISHADAQQHADAPATMPATRPATAPASSADQANPFADVVTSKSVVTPPAARGLFDLFRDVVRGDDQPAAVVAADTLISHDGVTAGALRVNINDSTIVRTNRPYARVSIGRDDIAEVRPLGPTELLVTPRRAGKTQIVFWDDQRRSESLVLQASADLRLVQDKLDELLPGHRIRVTDVGDRIGLVGTARDVAEIDTAVRVASSFGQVENLLEVPGGQQISLLIRFAEVSRSAGKEFGVNFGFTDGSGTIAGSNIGQISPLGFFLDGTTGTPTNLGIPDPNTGVQLFGLGSLNGDPFAYYINALRQSNLLRVLADPELVVLSGEQGEFLAGGEYPIPVPQERAIAIEYREFGIRLAYQPVVLGDGRIRMKLVSEVSDLDDTIGLAIGGVRVPGLRTRNTATVVEMREGQTLAISGLIRSNAVASKSVVPLLGDVPVLGALFRSTRYQRQETELVVLVTPRLVAAMDPDQVPPLPGGTWKHPNDIELMLFGQLGGDAGVALPDDADRDGSDDRARRGGPTHPGLQANYAFTPAASIE